MADKVTWFELPADDVTRASEFYSKTFGWSMSDMGGGSLYVQVAPSGEDTVPHEPGVINGDISPRSEAFDKPLIVITVDDIESKLKMVEQAGGSVALAPREVDGMNLIWAIVTDTEGNNVGVIQELEPTN